MAYEKVVVLLVDQTVFVPLVVLVDVEVFVFQITFFQNPSHLAIFYCFMGSHLYS